MAIVRASQDKERARSLIAMASLRFDAIRLMEKPAWRSSPQK